MKDITKGNAKNGCLSCQKISTVVLEYLKQDAIEKLKRYREFRALHNNQKKL